MRRENDLDIGAGSTRERLGNLGRMTMPLKPASMMGKAAKAEAVG